MSVLPQRALTLPDGRRVAWREAGSGPPLVLLHGWSMSSVVFAEVQAALTAGFRVLAPDLRGHGGSDPGPGYALEDFCADLEGWMAALQLHETALLGWSLGGQVAQLLALRRPESVPRLLLVASTPRFAAAADWRHGLPDAQVRAMARDLRRSYVLTMNGFFAGQFAEGELARERHREVVAFAVRAGRLPEPEAALAALETLRRVDLRPRLSRLQVPTLVLHGALDRIIPVGAGRFLGAALPRARFVEWAQVGHAPFLSQPLDCIALWREFLT